MGVTESPISSKFQVTVPEWVRRELGIDESCKLVWVCTEPGKMVVRCKKTDEDAVLGLFGSFKNKGGKGIVGLYLKEKVDEVKLENRIL